MRLLPHATAVIYDMTAAIYDCNIRPQVFPDAPDLPAAGNHARSPRLAADPRCGAAVRALRGRSQGGVGLLQVRRAML